MTLSKLELQQMLREMNIRFSAEEPYESLKQRLQQEHHNLWLKSVLGDKNADGKTDSVVVRKRKKKTSPQGQDSSLSNTVAAAVSSKKADVRPTTGDRGKPQFTYRPLPIEKPSPGGSWKAVADGTEPFNRKKRVFESVLRRARKCCEHCGTPSNNETENVELAPYHLQALTNGGEHSIKNVVALCPACLESMEKGPDPKIIKALKRKTRAKLYDSLQVMKKKPARGRGRAHQRRR